MKKWKNRIVRIFLAAAAMVMLFALPVQAQASAKSTYKKAVSYYKSGKYSKARKQFKKLSKNANEKCVKNMSSKMKAAYLKVVKKYVKKDDGYGSSVWGYFLTDIDKDGKAELIIQYGYAESTVKAYVYKYKNGKAKSLGSFYCGYACFYYDPRGNGLVMTQCRQLVEDIATVKIKNGKIKVSYWADRRRVKSRSKYMYIPYSLDSHVSYNKNYKTVYDYSPLK